MKPAVADGRLTRTGLKVFALVVVALLVARVLGIISVYFLEGDEISLALGAAALVKGTAGSFYRYTVQLGYYRLTELLDLLIGGRIDAIPWIVKGLSAVAGTVIPVVGFFAFKRELSFRERWLLVLVLAVNPVVWRSSQYGNTAILSTALSTVALVILSNRPGNGAVAGAFGLMGLAVLVRADAVLLTPVVFALLWVASSPRRAIRLTAAFGLSMLVVYAVILSMDPRIDSPLGSISSHMLETPNPTMFWEFLVWAMSPFLLAFAVLGLRSLADSRPQLLAVLVIWCVPTLLFYFRATTTVRYFMNVAVPLSIATVVGMQDVATRAQTWVSGRVAWAMVIGVATIHLFVALGRVMTNQPLELFYGGTFTTHDGPMPTGALLVRTYLAPGSFARSLPRPRFATQSSPFWEGVSFTKALSVIADPSSPTRTVVVLLDGGFGHAFHFHAHGAGAKYSSGPTREHLWESPIWLELGNARVMTIGPGSTYEALERFDVKAGDAIWVLGPRPFPNAEALGKLPAGLGLTPSKSFDPHFRTFDVVGQATQ